MPNLRPLRAALPLIASLVAIAPALAQTHGARPKASIDRPDIIFHNYCSVCHGEKGDGKSLARFALDPPPADFTSPKLREKVSRAHMVETVKKGARTKEGKPTAMVSWTRQLSPRHIDAVVDYIIVKFMDGKVASDEAVQESHAHHGHEHGHVKQVDYPYGLKPNAQRGKALYAQHCADCHGERGDGQGGAAVAGAAKPRSFREADFREFATGFSLFSAVSRSTGHSPSWDKVMGNQDIADVSEHVLRTFAKPNSRRNTK